MITRREYNHMLLCWFGIWRLVVQHVGVKSVTSGLRVRPTFHSIILLPWRWRRQFVAKRWKLYVKPHVTFQKLVSLIFAPWNVPAPWLTAVWKHGFGTWDWWRKQFWIDLVIKISHEVYFFFLGMTTASGAGFPHCRGFTITLRHTALGRIILDEWSGRLWNLYWQHSTAGSNPQYYQARGRRPTPLTARPRSMLRIV